MNPPKVSIGVPVYNADRYLAGCLESLCAQTMTDLEIVISDNHSSDQTEAICRDFASRDPRVRYFRQRENRGSAWNFNEVFRQSRGRYFKWQAYDDLSAPTFLERCCEVLDQQPDVVWCHSLSIRLDADDQELPLPTDANPAHSVLPPPGRSSRTSSSPAERFRAVVLGTPFCADTYGLIRRQALAQTRLELPFYGSEKPMLAELALLGKFVEIHDVLCGIREHADSSGALETAQAQQDFVAPGHRSSGLKTRLQLLHAFTTASFRHPVTWGTRMHCVMTMGSYILQFRKWARIRRQIFQRQAIRGAAESDSVAHQHHSLS